MRKFISIIIMVCMLCTAAAAFAENTAENPFIGTWESYIPSADMTMTFTYKDDGTFTYEMSGVPADQGGVGEGAYMIYGNIQVTWLAFEGASAYTFEVSDENTIQVTEITVENGEIIPGNTTPFTRVAESESAN